MAEETKTSTNSWVWWALGIAAVVLILFWIFQTSSGPGVPNTGAVPMSTSSTSGGAMTVSSLVQDPAVYDGQVVNIEGTVTKMYSPRIMAIGDVGSVGGKGLIVVSPRQIDASAGDTVAIAGKIQVGVVKDLLNKIGLSLPSGDNLAGQQALLIATTISKTSGSSQGGSSGPSSSSGTMPAPAVEGGATSTPPQTE